MTRVSTIDYHTGGEPFRIVAEPGIEIPGATVAERRMFAMQDADVDGLRRLLCFEPRGHADMYGGFIVPADDDGAHFGVLFWHKDGFSTACGHGTIALGAWAVDTGRVAVHPGRPTDVVVDVPSGRVTARVHTRGDRVVAVEFVNVVSRLVAANVPVATARGTVEVDVAYGGAIYACLDARTVGLEVTPAHLPALIAIGREVKWALNDTEHARHPDDDRLSGVYGTIVFEDLGADEHGPRQRNVTIFADGQVDRSPCGSGTCARLAVLAASGAIRDGERLVHESIVGSRFEARVLERTDGGIRPQVTGMAYRTGEHVFDVDPADPLVPGFALR